MLIGMTKALGDSFLVTQAQGAGLAAGIAATFADMVERGLSFKDALDQLKPSIDLLRETLQRSGVDGGDAFKFLVEMAKAADDAISGPLLDAIAGANGALKGLWNAGILTQDAFTGLVQTATQAFAKIIANGTDANVAMTMMAPTLQTIWELWKDQGFAIDDATLALIQEAEAQGKVGDSHRSIASQMLIATKEIAEAVRALARALGVDLPENAEEAAKRIKAAMKDVATSVSGVTMPGAVPNPPGGADGASTGGYVTASGIQRFAGGGVVLPFKARGTDTVPAMLTPGEMILTRGQQRSLLGGGGNVALLAEVRAMRADQARRDARLTEAVARAVKNEVQKVGGRRR